MKKADPHYQAFKQGSTTYFNSSIFFPPQVRREVFYLYGFVRIADNFVDAVPQDAEGFYDFKNTYLRAREGAVSGNPIIDRFVELEARKNFDPAWTEAFLSSMEADLRKSEYNTLEETLGYIYGSAEVIGFFMSRILGLPEEALEAAALQGRAMQYINFIRDIKEDLQLGRRYLPLEGSDLPTLEEEYVKNNPQQFIDFHTRQIELYREWQRGAEEGYRFIPKRYRIPIKTAADMYLWTAEQIEMDPLVVYRRKVKPNKSRIVLKALQNLFV
ncbi:MAG: phytoene/squalene synthase family protein [Sediminispirochaetaceae bacterium]